MVLLSYLGHAYVWGDREPPERIPAVLAKPWTEVSDRLGRPPILSYASYALDNWRRLRPEEPIELGNIALIQNFLGGIDEEWFILIHVDIEVKASPALCGIVESINAVVNNDSASLEMALRAVDAALAQMYATLERMPEHCDPYIYYRRVRPYIHGWKNNPATPEGMVYEGVFGDQPQLYRGETGAQSSIIPSLDALLGVTHKDDPLKAYLTEMRGYMPPKHRAFIAAVEQAPSVRDYVKSESIRALVEVYDSCVDWVERFRSLHLEYAAAYIHKQAQTDDSNPTSIGTGGTPFMRYLRKHRDETAEHQLEPAVEKLTA